MNAKKTEGSNLEKNKRFFLEIGFIAALLVVFTAFSFKIADNSDLVSVSIDSKITSQDYQQIKIVDDEKQKNIPKPKVVIQPTKIVEVNKKEDEDTLKGFGIDKPNVTNIGNIEPESVIETQPFINPEKKPRFPGGVSALLKFVHDNLEYSDELIQAGVQGRIVMKFVVGKDGKARTAEVLDSQNSLLVKAVNDVIAKLPIFEPAEQAGDKVPAYFVLPVEFKIQ